MSLGAVVCADGNVTVDEWRLIVGVAVAVLSALWSWTAQHPSHVDVLAELHELTARSGSANIATNDGAPKAP